MGLHVSTHVADAALGAATEIGVGAWCAAGQGEGRVVLGLALATQACPSRAARLSAVAEPAIRCVQRGASTCIAHLAIPTLGCLRTEEAVGNREADCRTGGQCGVQLAWIDAVLPGAARKWRGARRAVRRLRPQAEACEACLANAALLAATARRTGFHGRAVLTQALLPRAAERWAGVRARVPFSFRMRGPLTGPKVEAAQLTVATVDVRSTCKG
jgi:hypothetical protein